MKKFNNRRLVISGVLFLLVAVLVLFMHFDIFTYSRYESTMASSNQINTAIYLLNDQYQQIAVRLPDVVPGNNQYTYTFSVSNFTATKHCETNLKYVIHVRTTTNMHIDYDIFNTLNIENAQTHVISNRVLGDNDSTYFRHIYTPEHTMLYDDDQTDYYTLLFTFPDDYDDAVYSGMADYIEINIESRQILAGDS